VISIDGRINCIVQSSSREIRFTVTSLDGTNAPANASAGRIREITRPEGPAARPPLSLRTAEQIWQSCVGKIRPIGVSSICVTILAYLLDDRWTDRPIEEMRITPEGTFLARAATATFFGVFKLVEAQLTQGIVRIADVAELDYGQWGLLAHPASRDQTARARSDAGTGRSEAGDAQVDTVSAPKMQILPRN
jgi:hypothetical protein